MITLVTFGHIGHSWSLLITLVTLVTVGRFGHCGHCWSRLVVTFGSVSHLLKQKERIRGNKENKSMNKCPDSTSSAKAKPRKVVFEIDKNTAKRDEEHQTGGKPAF